ncbi:hypothetical protein [Paracoccus indicus]|uniref:hypothetical protein n=1 Tax=Paracoccus indicus TaxID=2079229 RepID=UPI000D3A05AA|nr:hypothetical protein [Paracoccus indicus]
MIPKAFSILVAAAALAACTPRSFETPPVMVETPQGPVTCQLYTSGLTDWDRATDAPAGMSVAVADSYCKKEGMARK